MKIQSYLNVTDKGTQKNMPSVHPALRVYREFLEG